MQVWHTSYSTTNVCHTKWVYTCVRERETREKLKESKVWSESVSSILLTVLSLDPLCRPRPIQLCGQSSEKGPKVFSDWSSQQTMNAVCLVHHCHLGVGQRASHLCCLSCKQLTHHDEWKVCGERGSRSGMVGVMIRDREVERELCLGLGMLQRCLIEGCFNAVGGWQVGIIIAICLRSRHPDWLLMAAACVVLPSTRVNLTFITVWKTFAHLLSFPLLVYMKTLDSA